MCRSYFQVMDGENPLNKPVSSDWIGHCSKENQKLTAKPFPVKKYGLERAKVEAPWCNKEDPGVAMLHSPAHDCTEVIDTSVRKDWVEWMISTSVMFELTACKNSCVHDPRRFNSTVSWRLQRRRVRSLWWKAINSSSNCMTGVPRYFRTLEGYKML